MNIAKPEVQEYMQSAHLRYVVDYYSANNGRTIKSRKRYLSLHIVGLLGLLTLAWLVPDFRYLFSLAIAVVLYQFGKEIGRRAGYLHAYKSLLEYDETYLRRWKEIKENNKSSDLGHGEANKNIRESLNRLDFAVNDAD